MARQKEWNTPKNKKNRRHTCGPPLVLVRVVLQRKPLVAFRDLLVGRLLAHAKRLVVRRGVHIPASEERRYWARHLRPPRFPSSKGGEGRQTGAKQQQRVPR